LKGSSKGVAPDLESFGKSAFTWNKILELSGGNHFFDDTGGLRGEAVALRKT
jgi:hypothetical protein